MRNPTICESTFKIYKELYKYMMLTLISLQNRSVSQPESQFSSSEPSLNIYFLLNTWNIAHKLTPKQYYKIWRVGCGQKRKSIPCSHLKILFTKATAYERYLLSTFYFIKPTLHHLSPGFQFSFPNQGGAGCPRVLKNKKFFWVNRKLIEM